ASSRPARGSLLRALQDLARGVRTGPAGDAAARVRAGAREEQSVEQVAVPRLAEQRPPREELVERGLRVLGGPAGQAVGGLHVGRRDPLARLDELAEPGRVGLERLD